MAVTQSSSERPHALTLGCTGMLTGAALGLQADDYTVSYLSRSGRLPGEATGTSHTCSWDNEASLRRAVMEAIEIHGMPKLVLAWAHSVGPVMKLAEYLSNSENVVRFHHVLGSRVSDPSRNNPLKRIKLGFDALPGIQWHAVRLGYVLEHGRSRWLSNDEISSGTLQAVRLKSPIYSVGQIAPWKLRP